MAIVAGLVWWSALLAVTIFGWLDGDWIWHAATGLAILGTAVITLLVAGRWKHLSLIADSTTLRFGVHIVARKDLAAISTGPVAKKPAQFWFGVVSMALAQDLSRKVYFESGDRRALLEVSDLYGPTQLARLALFLGVPFAADGRLDPRRA